MRVNALPGIVDSHQLRAHVLAEGCYSPRENQRIYDKWFSGERPRDRLIEALTSDLDLGSRVVCDVGCAYGMHVLAGGPGSYGLELEPYEAEFARSLGLEVHQRDVLRDDLEDLPRAEVVLALAIIEHLDAPHVFLRRLHGLLGDAGLLVLETPRKPPFRWLERAPVLRRVYGDHDDHVNAFTASTLAFACERAGFEVVRYRYWSKPLARRLRAISPWVTGRFPLSLLANGVVLEARKIDGWEYGPQATRQVRRGGKGYEYRGASHPEAPAADRRTSGDGS